MRWTDPSDVTKGFKYLYLKPEDYEQLAAKGAVHARRVEVEGGEVHWVLDAIIGKDPDLGVENLRGSGTIAGETARAYQDVFTLTYVTGRTVGIGAYLVRLGHRTIQKAGAAPILLTGYQALNKLIGSSVYTSNLQLGGPKVRAFELAWVGVDERMWLRLMVLLLLLLCVSPGHVCQRRVA